MAEISRTGRFGHQDGEGTSRKQGRGVVYSPLISSPAEHNTRKFIENVEYVVAINSLFLSRGHTKQRECGPPTLAFPKLDPRRCYRSQPALSWKTLWHPLRCCSLAAGASLGKSLHRGFALIRKSTSQTLQGVTWLWWGLGEGFAHGVEQWVTCWSRAGRGSFHQQWRNILLLGGG